MIANTTSGMMTAPDQRWVFAPPCRANQMANPQAIVQIRIRQLIFIQYSTCNGDCFFLITTRVMSSNTV
jgi:hypothetical protein